MRFRRTSRGVEFAAAGGWRAVAGLVPDGPGADDLISWLRRRDDLAALAGDAVLAGDEPPDEPSRLPFEPRLLRCFASWEQHWEQASRGLLRRYLPAAYPVARGFEAVTRSTFPPLRAGRLFRQEPSFYLGNHLTVVPDGATIGWPSYSADLDYELELACVLVRPLRDATPEAALDAVGGFLVLNDVTARDEQWRQARHGILGPIGKAKTFATSVSAEVVTADEVLPYLDDLAARVVVNGEVWARTSTAGIAHGLGASLAHASRGETLQPGELVTLGTMPSGAGIEIDRRVRPGDVVTLEIDRVGSVTNTIGPRES